MFIFANNRQTKQTMRKDVAVLMVLWVMCIPYATFICASATPNKLDTLKAFLRKKILYDEYVPIDSVICWSENILPVIKTNNRNDENYFLLQLQLANAYTLRGDISLAIDRARLMYEEAKEKGVYIYGSGRSDMPNQVNNSSVFPGLFRGALDVRARQINEEMKLAAAHALADLAIHSGKLDPDHVVVDVFDPQVPFAVAKAVAKAAIASGVARATELPEKYRD